MKKILLLSLFIFLIGISFVSAECTDTDGGIDYFNKGVIDSEKEDYCPIDKGESQSEKKLIEYYCKDFDVKDLIYWCEDKCENGACTENPKEFECPSYGILSLLNNNQAIYFNGVKYIANPTLEYKDGEDVINIYVDNVLYEFKQQYDSISIEEGIVLKLGGMSGVSAVPIEVQYCFEEADSVTSNKTEQKSENKNYIYYIVGGIILVIIGIYFWFKKR